MTGTTGADYRIPDLIIKKRNGHELSSEEIDFFIRSICDSNNNLIQESQIGAMLMAIYFRSMTYDESFLITKAMLNSGARFRWPQYKNCVVDKHSTGGVGDKISLPLAPALAACGLKVNFKASIIFVLYWFKQTFCLRCL
jgi:thymidine phosphorylase